MHLQVAVAGRGERGGHAVRVGARAQPQLVEGGGQLRVVLAEGVQRGGDGPPGVARFEGAAHDVQDLRPVAHRHPHPVADPRVQQVEQALAGHRLVRSACGAALGEGVGVGLGAGADAAQGDGPGLAGDQGGHLDARIGGGDPGVVGQHGAYPGRVQGAVRADRERRRQAHPLGAAVEAVDGGPGAERHHDEQQRQCQPGHGGQ